MDLPKQKIIQAKPDAIHAREQIPTTKALWRVLIRLDLWVLDFIARHGLLFHDGFQFKLEFIPDGHGRKCGMGAKA